MTPKEAYNYAGLRGTQLLKRDSAYVLNSEKELEFIFQARAALEKQVPKNLSSAKESHYDYFICPVCRHKIGVVGYPVTWDRRPKYCDYCGQALDWGDDKCQR